MCTRPPGRQRSLEPWVWRQAVHMEVMPAWASMMRKAYMDKGLYQGRAVNGLVHFFFDFDAGGPVAIWRTLGKLGERAPSLPRAAWRPLFW